MAVLAAAFRRGGLFSPDTLKAENHNFRLFPWRNFKNHKFAGSIFPMIFSGDAAPEINAGLSARQHVRTVVIASYNFRHKSRGMGFFAMFW